MAICCSRGNRVLPCQCTRSAHHQAPEAHLRSAENSKRGTARGSRYLLTTEYIASSQGMICRLLAASPTSVLTSGLQRSPNCQAAFEILQQYWKAHSSTVAAHPLSSLPTLVFSDLCGNHQYSHEHTCLQACGKSWAGWQGSRCKHTKGLPLLRPPKLPICPSWR